MISLYEPFLCGNEKKYVNDCLDTTWISSRGKYVNLFEEKFAEFTGAGHAVAVFNGTVAIHLALAALDIGAGDEVIVPTFTYIASVNPIRYMGAVPVFVDSTADNWQMDIDAVEKAITDKTKAVIAVHLYGGVCDMERLAALCRSRGIRLIEDCAEALGSKFNGRHVGTFGDIGCFSFFGNKTITTGEGGMTITSDADLAAKLAHLKSQGVSSAKYYWHDVIGYNFRMTNIQAAIGLAQLENVGEIFKRKREIASFYRDEFAKRALPLELLWEKPGCVNCFWLPTIALNDASRRDSLIADLKANHGVESRPAFYPVHTMPMYESFAGGAYLTAEKLSAAGMNIPGFPGLKKSDQIKVIDALAEEL